MARHTLRNIPANPKEKAVTATQQGAPEKTGTDERPFVVKISPNEVDKVEAEHREKERQDKNQSDNDLVYWPRVMAVLALAQFAALVIQACIFRAQSKRLKETVDEMRKEFAASHRARLRIRNVDVHQPGIGNIAANGSRSPALPVGPLFRPGDYIIGQAYVANIGDSEATITETGCWVEWMQRTLPMRRPYEGDNGNVPISSGTMLKPGGSLPIAFRSDRPMGREAPLVLQCSDGWHTCVMGWVEYVDKLQTRRRTAFCREYRMPEGRFLKVNDPDYEHEE